MDKMRRQILDYVFPVAITLFLAWAAQALIVGDREFLFDRIFAAFQVGLIWAIWRRFHIPLPSLLVAAFAVFLHQLKLYGNSYFGFGFDNYMHLAGGFAIALLVYAIVRESLSVKHNHWSIRMLLTFTAAVGIAALIEPLEFLGYAELGTGDGILFYGAGDGGWRDTAADLAANMVGALVAGAVLTWQEWRKR